MGVLELTKNRWSSEIQVAPISSFTRGMLQGAVAALMKKSVGAPHMNERDFALVRSEAPHISVEGVPHKPVWRDERLVIEPDAEEQERTRRWGPWGGAGRSA